jgi:cob(I)alamin adenosyltransferase
MLLASYRAVRMKNAHHQVENLAAHLAAMRRSYAALEAARTVIRRVEKSARFAGLRLG